VVLVRLVIGKLLRALDLQRLVERLEVLLELCSEAARRLGVQLDSRRDELVIHRTERAGLVPKEINWLVRVHVDTVVGARLNRVWVHKCIEDGAADCKWSTTTMEPLRELVIDEDATDVLRRRANLPVWVAEVAEKHEWERRLAVCCGIARVAEIELGVMGDAMHDALVPKLGCGVDVVASVSVRVHRIDQL